MEGTARMGSPIEDLLKEFLEGCLCNGPLQASFGENPLVGAAGEVPLEGVLGTQDYIPLILAA
jgi:hypothetical protein